MRRNAPDHTPVRAWWRDRNGAHERLFTLGALKGVVRIVPGEKIAYVTDARSSEGNTARITELAANADHLFIECAFLHDDAGHADRRAHLTARQAGALARAAGARLAVPFHFSPRYEGRAAELRAEFEAAHTDHT